MDLRLIALGVASAIAVASGCDSGGSDAEVDSTAPVVQLGAPGETNRVLGEDELASTPTMPAYTAGDVDFVNSMIAHHQQALDMTALVDTRSADDGLPLLAERMEVSQIAEIEQLQGWLTARGEDPEGYLLHAGMQMPGMLTTEQMAALETASGEEFDALFLQSMIQHHEGAVIMVETLVGQGLGGQEPQLFQIAQGIESDQQVEIARMKSLLVELAPAVSTEGG
jgi:uncharacterized protein (DUF305 family)